MAKNKLSDRQCKAAKAKALLSDGGNLYLAVNSETAKSWRFIYKKSGKRTEIGLGAYPDVSLARARDIAADMRGVLAAGRDPKSEIAQAKADKAAEPTFAEMAARYIETRGAHWKNEKHRAQWVATLGPLHCARIVDMRVSQISRADVLAVLRPIWTTKPETASRVRGRIENVLSLAKAEGWRDGENPAAWRDGLETILGSTGEAKRAHKPIKHHASMPAKELPSFMAALTERDAMAAFCLRFIILTAARSGEARGARWDEIDTATATWIVPATRMKAGRPHRVPLSIQAMEIIERLGETQQNELVFPSVKMGGVMSDMAFAALFKRMNVTGITTHGFRSTFRDWCATNGGDRVAAEISLAHSVGSAVERAYFRDDLLEQRRALMQSWANYCDGQTGANVVQLRGAK